MIMMSKSITIIIIINSHKKCLNNNSNQNNNKIKLTIFQNRSNKVLTVTVIDNSMDNKMINYNIYQISCIIKNTFLMAIMFQNFIILSKIKKIFRIMNQFYKKSWLIYLMQCFSKIFNLLKHI